MGRKLIAAMFYELAGSELADFPVPESSSIGDFPDELINLIKNYRPVELKSLIEALADTQKRLDALAVELHDDRTWKKDFQEAIEKQSREIDKLLEGLKEEKDARKEEDKAIRSKLEGMSGFFSGFRAIWAILGLIVAAVIGVAMDHWWGKLFRERGEEERGRERTARELVRNGRGVLGEAVGF
jgi:hypothetical protein